MAVLEGTFLGRYEILDKLGAGGMGEVYRARDSRLDREVAVKVLPEKYASDPHALARFLREGKAVAALSHPNIVALYDIGTEEGRPFAVMELLEGQPLSLIIRQGPIDWTRALAMVLSMADGLAAAHAKRIIHRDIKPENVFLTRSGVVKILDFGLARLGTKDAVPTPQQTAALDLDTQPGMVMGTVAYMSPEQLRGLPADARSDVFACGCMLYEMLTGRKPFARSSGADTMSAILHETPTPLGLADCPSAVERVVFQCLEKDPAQRFAGGDQLAAALRKINVRDSEGRLYSETEQVVVTPRSGTLIASPPATSVAVLPFVNMSSDPENEYFSDGLAEELINVLSKVQGLQVAARTSAFAFKGKNEDVRKIGEQLNVHTVLEGSVRKSGSRLRITAQLVNVADGYRLWSETYNRTMEDVFAIQDEIAQSIAKALRGVLTEKDQQALERQQTVVVAAYDYYLRGRLFFHQFRRRGFEFALQMFDKAIAIDPNYALAYAGLADCHSLLFTYWKPAASHRDQAEAASKKALEFGPEVAEAHVARGLAVALSKQFEEASQEYASAIRLNPRLFEAYYFHGRACLARGQKDEAVRLFEKALELRPDDYQSCTHLATLYAGMNRLAQSNKMARQAIEVAQKRLALNPDDARALYLGAVMLCRLGEVEKGLDWASQAMAMDPEEPVTLYNVACVYGVQNQIDQALDCLERAVQHGFAHKQWIENDSDLQVLHGQPRYQALLEKL